MGATPSLIVVREAETTKVEEIVTDGLKWRR